MRSSLRILITGLIFILPAAGLWAQSDAGYKTLLNIQQTRTAGKTRFYSTVSDAGGPLAVAVPAGVLAMALIKEDKTLRNGAFYLFGSLAINEAFTQISKRVINRPRPFVTHSDIIPLAHTSPYSFPSGHASRAFTMAASVSLVYPKWYVVVPAYATAGLISYSRLYLGVHYPGDVIGGALIGSGSAIAGYKLMQWWQRKTQKKRNKTVMTPE